MRSSAPIVRSRARRLVAKTGRGLVALLLLATFAALAVTFAPGLLGYQRYVLVGGSMEPTIHRGSIVFDDLVRVRELRAGDVITYQPPGATKAVTHRIISAKRQKTGSPIFRTQGDANAAADMRPFKLDQADAGALPLLDPLPRLGLHPARHRRRRASSCWRSPRC